MARALAQTSDIAQLKTLHDHAAAWEEANRRFNRAFEEVVRFAVFRIQVERKIGSELSQTVRPGRVRKRSHNATFSEAEKSTTLPTGINKSMSSRYRQIAKIDEDVFERYLAHAAQHKVLPSSNGLRHFAGRETRMEGGPSITRKKRTDKAMMAIAIPAEVIKAVGAFMDVDVCVGTCGELFPGVSPLDSSNLQTKQLKGNVFVALCPDPASWLRKLSDCRVRNQFVQVIMALPAVTNSEWFEALEEKNWACCFIKASDGAPLMVVYHGQRFLAFRIAFRGLGVTTPSLGQDA